MSGIVALLKKCHHIYTGEYSHNIVLVSWLDWSASRSNNLSGAAVRAPAFKMGTVAIEVATAFTRAHFAAGILAKIWPAHPFVTAAQVLAANGSLNRCRRCIHGINPII